MEMQVFVGGQDVGVGEGVSVMRRIKDSFMNATQILKVAGFSKPKRSKILETEIHLALPHEKVQGGHGSYQGTWVPLSIAIELATKYGVNLVLAPLLSFDPAIHVLAPRPLIVRRKSLGAAGSENVSPTLSSTEGVDASPMASIDALSKDLKSETSAREAMAMRPPEPVSKKVPSPTGTITASRMPEHVAITKRTPIRSRAPSSTTIESPDAPRASLKDQEPTPKYPTEIAHTHLSESTYPYAPVPSFPSVSRRLFDDEPAQHHFFASVHNRRQRIKHDDLEFGAGNVDNYTYTPISNPPLLSPAVRNQELLLHIFSKQDNGLNNAYLFELIRDFNEKSHFDVDLVLDERESTLLHWAVACSRINLSRLLLARGATVMKVAKGGETVLMRALTSLPPFTNRSMEEIMVLLGSSLFAADEKKRTALHHAVLLSKFRSKRAMSNYYVECISNFIEDAKKTSLVSFAAFLDSTDEKGETALHLACRYRNHRIVFLLLSLGASKTIQNTAGETAISISAYDPRLKKLMQFLPDPEFDDYLDAPTTPMSDFSETGCGGGGDVKSVSTAVLEVNKSSCSTLSSMAPLLPDGQVSATAQQLASSRMHVAEMKYQKAKFEEVLKYAGKVQVGLNRPSTPLPLGIVPTTTISDPTPTEDETAKKRVPGAALRQHQQETRLSARLIRLESLVKASKEEQYEILKLIDLIKQERALKDERYCRLIATAFKCVPEAMEGILMKIGEHL